MLAIYCPSLPVGSSLIILDMIKSCQFFSFFVFIASLTKCPHPHSTQSNCKSTLQFNLSPSSMKFCFFASSHQLVTTFDLSVCDRVTQFHHLFFSPPFLLPCHHHFSLTTALHHCRCCFPRCLSRHLPHCCGLLLPCFPLPQIAELRTKCNSQQSGSPITLYVSLIVLPLS